MNCGFFLTPSGDADHDAAMADELLGIQADYAAMADCRGEDRTERCLVCGHPDNRRCCTFGRDTRRPSLPARRVKDHPENPQWSRSGFSASGPVVWEAAGHDAHHTNREQS